MNSYPSAEYLLWTQNGLLDLLFYIGVGTAVALLAIIVWIVMYGDE